jgi:Fe-S cluster assembly protein SufD
MTRLVPVGDAFAAAVARRDGLAGRPAWLGFLARAAYERFIALGWPHVRQEEWRFTNPAPLVETAFADAFALPATATTAVAPPTPAFAAIDLPLVDGRFDAVGARVPTLPPGAWVGGLAAALHEQALSARVEGVLGSIAAWQERPFLALNTALVADGAFVFVPQGAALSAPVRIAYAASSSGAPGADGAPRASHPRALVIVERGARLVLVEDFRNATHPGDWLNAALEIDVREGAEVEHVALVPGVAGAFHTGAVFARVARDGRFTSRSFALGGRLTRRDVHVTFAGPDAVATLEGAFVTSGDDLVDFHTTVDHAVPECTSRETFMGVLAGRSRGVFNGAVVIRPGAQKSDARQSNKNLLLSGEATVNSKPELMIFADDVKCGHGATVGQLDAAALFYLRARGLDATAARALLTHAFVRGVAERIGPAAVRADVDAWLGERMLGLPT